jgi:hypothetical protein
VLAGPGRADLYIHRLEVPLVHPRYVELDHLVEEVRTYLLVNGVPNDEAAVLSNSQRALSQVVKTADPRSSSMVQSSSRWAATSSGWSGRRATLLGTSACSNPRPGCCSPATTSCPSFRRTSAFIPRARPDPLHDYLAGLRRMAVLEPKRAAGARRPFTTPPVASTR